MRKYARYVLFLLCISCIVFGVALRIKNYHQCDPKSITGDLAAVEEVWHNIRNTVLSKSPGNISPRIGQSSLALILGGLQAFTQPGFAYAAELLSLICSLGIVFAAGFFVYSLGGSFLYALITCSAFALVPHFLLDTLKAESESPFIFTLLMGQASLLVAFRSHRYWLLIPAGLFLLLSCGIKGTGVIHLASMIPLLFIFFLFDKSTNRKITTLIACTTLIIAVFSAYYGIQSGLRSLMLSQYERHEQREPIITNYTTAVMFDGLVMGPFPFSTPGKSDGSARRQEFIKGRDPSTGKPYSTPVSRNEPPLSIIKENPMRYLKNYSAGMWEVSKRYATKRTFNVWGAVPLWIGIVFLLWKRQWCFLAGIAAWLSVYILFVPAIFVNDRSVWPGSVVLALPPLWLLGNLWQMVNVEQTTKRPFLLWSVVVVFCSFFMGLHVMATPVMKEKYTNQFAEVSRKITPVTSEKIPVVYSPVATLGLFGAKQTFKQMIFSGEIEVQRKTLLAYEPDYIYLYSGYRKDWEHAYKAIRQVIADWDLPYALIYGTTEYGLFKKRLPPIVNLLPNGTFKELEDMKLKYWVPLLNKKWHVKIEEESNKSVLVLEPGTSFMQRFSLKNEIVGQPLLIRLRVRSAASSMFRANFYYYTDEGREVYTEKLEGTGEWKVLQFLIPKQKVKSSNAEILLGLNEKAPNYAEVSYVYVETAT